MKSYVYAIIDENFIRYAKVMLASLYKHAPDTSLLVSTIGDAALFSGMFSNFEYYETNFSSIGCVGINSWKMYDLRDKINMINDGSFLLKLDCDMLIQDNPFKIFDDSSADVIFAERQYSCRYVINAGLHAYRVNQNSRRFINHFCNTLRGNAWEPYDTFQKKFIRNDTWLDEQDYCCACVEETYQMREHPSEAHIDTVHPEWNWTEPYDDPKHLQHHLSVHSIKSKVGNSRYKILHFKGGLKEYLVNA